LKVVSAIATRISHRHHQNRNYRCFPKNQNTGDEVNAIFFAVLGLIIVAGKPSWFLTRMFFFIGSLQCTNGYFSVTTNQPKTKLGT